MSESKPLKIVKLTASNVKALHAIEVTPDGTLVTIGGKNGAGKSSVLDSIAYALGGTKLVPTEPIRSGQAEASIEVDLGDDIIVTRSFKREHPACDCAASGNAEKPKQQEVDAHAKNCAALTWGQTRSALVVKNRAGATYPSPQALLDKLVGKLAFDPLAFATARPDEQDKVLRKLVQLDTTPFEAAHREAYGRRALLNKQLDIAKVKLEQLPLHPNVPTAVASLDEVSQEMRRAEELRKLAADAERKYDAQRDVMQRVEGDVSAKAAQIGSLEAALDQARIELVALQAKHETVDDEVTALEVAHAAAVAAIPDVEVIRARLGELEATNDKVRANQARATQELAVSQLATSVKTETGTIEQANADKDAALAAVQFPVAGLGFGEYGITFNGVPFEQASTAEQLLVSVKIGLALNPTLKVLLVRNGNSLDADSLRLLTEQAQAADAQVWMEWVGTDKGAVSVLIQDGTVV